MFAISPPASPSSNPTPAQPTTPKAIWLWERAPRHVLKRWRTTPPPAPNITHIALPCWADRPHGPPPPWRDLLEYIPGYDAWVQREGDAGKRGVGKIVAVRVFLEAVWREYREAGREGEPEGGDGDASGDDGDGAGHGEVRGEGGEGGEVMDADADNGGVVDEGRDEAEGAREGGEGGEVMDVDARYDDVGDMGRGGVLDGLNGVGEEARGRKRKFGETGM